jgi:hypothetical protein
MTVKGAIGDPYFRSSLDFVLGSLVISASKDIFINYSIATSNASVRQPNLACYAFDLGAWKNYVRMRSQKKMRDRERDLGINFRRFMAYTNAGSISPRKSSWSIQS